MRPFLATFFRVLKYFACMTSNDWPEPADSTPSRFSLHRRDTRDLRLIVVTFCSLAMTLLAFALNMGWFRFMLLFTVLPFLLVGLHVLIGAVMYWKKWGSRLFYAASVLHPLGYVLLFDGGDVGTMYIFFGLIPLEPEYEIVGEVLAIFAAVAWVAAGGLLVTLMVQMWRAKKMHPSTPKM